MAFAGELPGLGVPRPGVLQERYPRDRYRCEKPIGEITRLRTHVGRIAAIKLFDYSLGLSRLAEKVSELRPIRTEPGLTKML